MELEDMEAMDGCLCNPVRDSVDGGLEREKEDFLLFDSLIGWLINADGGIGRSAGHKKRRKAYIAIDVDFPEIKHYIVLF